MEESSYVRLRLAGWFLNDWFYFRFDLFVSCFAHFIERFIFIVYHGLIRCD